MSKTWEDAPANQWEDAPQGWEDAASGQWEDAPPKADVFSRETLAIPFAAVGNTADRAISGIAGGAADLFGDVAGADDIFRNMEDRVASRNQWANPENKDQTFAGKAAGMVATLPMQIVAMGASPGETGQTLIKNGETLDTAQKAAAIDFAGNTAGMFIPGVGSTMAKRALSGAAINAVQDAAVRSAISGIAEQEASKKQFEPTWETAGLAAIPGAGFGAFSKPNYNPRTTSDRLNNLKAIVEVEKAKAEANTVREPIPNEAQRELPFASDVETIAKAQNEQATQRDLFIDEPSVKSELTSKEPTEPGVTTKSNDNTTDVIETPVAKDTWFTGSPQEKLSKTRTIEEQSARANAESQKVGPGHYITMDEGLARTYAGDNGHLYKLAEEPFTNALDFGKKYDGVFGETIYKNLVEETGSKVKANARLREMGYDAVVLKDNYGTKIANIFDAKPLSYMEQVKRDRSMPIELSLVPKEQRGGFDVKAIVDGFAKLLEPLRTRDVTEASQAELLNNVLLRQKSTSIQPDPLASSVVSKALEGPTGGANRFFSAGATLEALKRRSPLIKAVGEVVQNFGKRSEKWVRETVFPVEREFKKLSNIDLVEMNAIMKRELESDFRFTPDHLAQAGFNEKQIRAHQAMRELFDQTLKIQNEGRAAQGKEPISGIEAYHAARWDGDFGVELKNAAGEVVWKVRSSTRISADQQAKALMKKVPGLTLGRKFDRLNARGVETNDLQSAYSTLLDILGRDNPLVQQIRDVVEADASNTANAALANTQHFKKKSGMRGYIGDRPWVDPVKDAKQFFQQQIQYAKNASKWAEIQKAMPNLKEILSNEQLIARHPEQVKWAQEYVQNALGFGENRAVRMVENELGKVFGVSPKAVADVVGGMKYVWITQKLMASVGYNAVQAIQLANTAAWHSDLSAKGYSHNPIVTNIMGFIGGMQLGAVHTIDGIRGKLDSSKLSVLPDYMKAALEYAENNSVTNRSSYDETPIGQGNSITRGISKTVSLVDTFTRGIAYMSYVQHLKDSGRFTKETWGDMFKLAEDYTNASMGDARQTEKAPIFAKAGNVGSAFNTLQTFNVNWFNQWSYFSRELARGNPRPFFMGLVMQGLVAGAAGLPFMNDLDKAWEFVKTTLPTSTWNKVKDWNIKSVMLSAFGPDNLKAGETLTYGALSTATGLGLNSRLNSPSIIEAPQIPGGMVVDLTRQLTSVAKATASIDDPVKWSQAALDVSPPGLKEFVAQNLLEQYTQAKRPNGDTLPFARRDIAKREATVVRDEFDRKAANMGIRSQKEVVESDLLWSMKKQEAEARDRQKSLVEKIYSDVRNGKPIDDSIILYQQIGGNPDNLQDLMEKQAKEEFMSRVDRKTADPKTTVRTMLMLKKLKDLEDERKSKQTATP